jgi:hypothetical protein
MSRFFPVPRRARLAFTAVLLVGSLAVALSACSQPIASVYNEFTVLGLGTPKTASYPDTGSVELGMRFRASSDGDVMGVRFYKGAANTGTHTGTLWSNSGAKLATVTFNNESDSGWQNAAFGSNVAIKAGTTYVISYHTSGHYAADTGYFTRPIFNGPLTGLASGTDGGNSVFAYSSRTAFPTKTMKTGVNYWVDVVYTDGTMIGGNVDPETVPLPSTTTAKPTTTTAKATTTTTAKPATTTTTAKPATTTTTAKPTPPPSGFPTPATTGWTPTGVTLTPYTGSGSLNQAGTTIDGKDISTCLDITAPNVHITRSRIRCAGDFGVNQHGNASGMVLQDVEITSGSGILDRAVLITDGATLNRVYIHNMQRGVMVGDNVTVTSSYIGDNANGTDAHTTALASIGGSHHVVAQNNTLQTAPNTNASSAMSVYPEVAFGGANDDWLIDNNLFNTDGGYCVYLGYSPQDGESPNTNFRFTNNHFGTLYDVNCGMYGPVASWSNVASNTWSNNTWYDQRPTGSGYQNKNGQIVTP